MAILGKRNLLSVIRESSPGLYLDGGALGEILLPGRYIPKDLAPKQKLDVFVYRDSEDRLVATTETPHAMVGEFAYLKVINVHPQVGAFLDWGLAKDLLVPFREQEFPLRVGDWVVVYVALDATTNRILASTRLSRHLNRDTPAYRDGQPVNLLITGKTPLGYNAIVENAHRGLLYKNNLAAALKIGAKLKGFVRTVRANGKIDLSLDASGYKRVAPLTEQIVKTLESHGGTLGAASLDVFEVEPLPKDSPLWSLDNCFVTPHIAAASSETTGVAYFSKVITEHEAGKPLPNVVDVKRGY